MALLMARIDDRLVHGQVVVGCCEPLQARRLLVCDELDWNAVLRLQRRSYVHWVVDGLRRHLFKSLLEDRIIIIVFYRLLRNCRDNTLRNAVGR